MPEKPSTSGGIAERATALLAALGDHEDQVAASLHAAGITGVMEHCIKCPIAVHLLRSDLNPTHVVVHQDDAILFFGGQYYETADEFVTMPIPDPVKRFITGFDNGAYDELVAGGAR